MKRKLSLFVLLGLLLNTWLSAQTPEQYTNTRSEKHQQVPGTNILIIPPNGFKAGIKSSPVFYKDEFNYVAVEEMVGSNFNFAYAVRKDVAGSIASYTFQAEKRLIINGLNACEMQYFDPGTRKVGCHLLIIGNDRFAAIVRFFYRAPETSVEAVSACLHSVFADVDQYPDPLEGAGFTFDASRFGYGLVEHDEHSYFFTPMNDIPDADSVSALFMIGKIEKANLPENIAMADIHKNIMESTVDRFEKSGAEPAVQPITFKNLPALETTVNVREHGKPARVYVLTIELPDRYYSIMGFARRNLDAEMDTMKKLFQTMAFK